MADRTRPLLTATERLELVSGRKQVGDEVPFQEIPSLEDHVEALVQKYFALGAREALTDALHPEFGSIWGADGEVTVAVAEARDEERRRIHAHVSAALRDATMVRA